MGKRSRDRDGRGTARDQEQRRRQFMVHNKPGKFR